MFVNVRSPSTGTKGRSRAAPSADNFSLDVDADSEYLITSVLPLSLTVLLL
jgi:hypothetical protein